MSTFGYKHMLPSLLWRYGSVVSSCVSMCHPSPCLLVTSSQLEDMRAQWPMALRAAQVHASAVALATAGAAAATPQGRARAAELQVRHEQASERIVKLNRQTQEQQRKIHQVEGALANVHQRAQAAEAAVLQLQAERAALVDRVGTLQRGMDNLHAQLDESRT